MSRDQMHTALRVANVSADSFEQQVESANPPTVTALAEQGKKPAPKPLIDLNGRDPERQMVHMCTIQNPTLAVGVAAS